MIDRSTLNDRRSMSAVSDVPKRRFGLFTYGVPLSLLLLLCSPIVPFDKKATSEQANRHFERSYPSDVQTTQKQVGQVKKLSKEELEAILSSEFQGMLVLDDRGYISPNHIIGDFNNDNIKDIAILARPSKNLNRDDTSKPDFWLSSTHWGSSNFQKATGRRHREKLYYQYTLGELAMYRNLLVPIIAIIHGDPDKPWSGSKPRQKFVVLEGIDGTSDRMELYRGGLNPRPIGDIGIVPPPKLIGDALLFTSAGVGTVVYWDRGGYYWYPFEPKDFESEKLLRLGSRPQCRMSHLKEWVNELPIDNSAKPPRNFFKLPEVGSRLVWLLGAAGYNRLLNDFAAGSPIMIIEDFLVMKGSSLKGDPKVVSEEAIVAIRLNDPEGLCTICVGFAGKGTGQSRNTQPEWECMRGEYLRSTEDILPIRILAMFNK